MGAMDTDTANWTLDATLDPGGGYAVGDVYVRLMKVLGTATTPGTELTNTGGYTAGGLVALFDPASGRKKTLASLVAWTNLPGEDLVGVEFWDSDSTPKRLWRGELSTPRELTAGDAFSLPEGTVVADLP